MKFRINNQVADLGKNSVASRAEAILMKKPVGDMLDIRGLAAEIGLSVDRLKNTLGDVPAEFKVKVSNKMIYGHPKTISAYKKHLQTQRSGD